MAGEFGRADRQRRIRVLWRAAEIQGWLWIAGSRLRRRERLRRNHHHRRAGCACPAPCTGEVIVMSADLGRLSAVEMRQRIVKKELSPVEITKRALQAAESTQKTLNAFSSLMPETALA